jgi:vacuolar-type H+-ATPase subunit E/Vma4
LAGEMGCEELIQALRKEAGEKTREIWELAEEEAGRIRADLSCRLEALRKDSEAVRSSDEACRMLREADKGARVIMLTTYERLSHRLYALAASSLRLLREKAYEKSFERLALELPPFRWQRVRVCPDDSELARKFFPGAEIVIDRSISGGMEAEAEEGSIRIVNTFEKRLERSWTEMLPNLLYEINGKVIDSGTPPKS